MFRLEDDGEVSGIYDKGAGSGKGAGSSEGVLIVESIRFGDGGKSQCGCKVFNGKGTSMHFQSRDLDSEPV